MAVTFDGPNKLIIVDFGVTELDAMVDLYSDWKEWVQISDNSKYLQALRTVAGDPTKPGQLISPYFFIMNGWAIRPHEADHDLAIEGNLYGEVVGGVPQDMFTPTLGDYSVIVTIERSVNALTVEVGGTSVWTNAEKAQIRDSLGVDGSKTTAVNGQLQAIGTTVANIETRQISNEERLVLLGKIATNRLELADGPGDNWILYDDDSVTPILAWPVRDKSGSSILQPVGQPSRRGKAVVP